jgi:hypothetical protein
MCAYIISTIDDEHGGSYDVYDYEIVESSMAALIVTPINGNEY